MLALAGILSLLQLVVGIWFLWAVYQISVKWALFFLIGGALILRFLTPVVGEFVAAVVVVGMTGVFLRDNWHAMRKPASWLFGVVGAGIVLGFLMGA